jgi:hypothetical protein
MPQKVDSDCIKKGKYNLSKRFIKGVVELHQIGEERSVAISMSVIRRWIGG